MLQKLLEWITKEGAYKPTEFARRLGVSQELVEQAVRDLVKAGYLKQVEGCTQGECTACSSSNICSAGKARLWIRTNKG
ncbi:MAG: hypothetical protein EHM41_08085 [Chloroflexi bacterium]|nr:MAG: hypothetical protein EHM41_08085 [Chloroflexota bacterium]